MTRTNDWPPLRVLDDHIYFLRIWVSIGGGSIVWDQPIRALFPGVDGIVELPVALRVGDRSALGRPRFGFDQYFRQSPCHDLFLAGVHHPSHDRDAHGRPQRNNAWLTLLQFLEAIVPAIAPLLLRPADP
jgi:hypothetical protein